MLLPRRTTWTPVPRSSLVPQVADHRLHRYGVSQYYTLVQESYRNPHYAGLKKVISCPSPEHGRWQT